MIEPDRALRRELMAMARREAEKQGEIRRVIDTITNAMKALGFSVTEHRYIWERPSDQLDVFARGKFAIPHQRNDPIVSCLVRYIADLAQIGADR